VDYDVTAKIEVLRKSTTWVTGVIEFQANGGYGVVSGEKGLRPRTLANTKGDSIDGGQDFLEVGRSAAHSNTLEKRGELKDSFLVCRESIEGKGDKR